MKLNPVEGAVCPNPAKGFSAGLVSAGFAPNGDVAGFADPNANGAEPPAVDVWPNGVFVEGAKVKAPVFGASGLPPFTSIPFPRIGLSSIIIPEESPFLGGVTARESSTTGGGGALNVNGLAAALVVAVAPVAPPNSIDPPAPPAGADGALNVKGFFSAVADVGGVKVNGDFGGSVAAEGLAAGG